MWLKIFLICFACIYLTSAINPIPGWEYMFAGYDIRNASSKTYINGIKDPIFVPTYKFGQTYAVPNTTLVYDVPDQFSAFPIYQTNVLTSTNIFESLVSMLTEEASSFSFSIGFNIAGFGFDASYETAQGYEHLIFSQQDRAAAKGHIVTKTTQFVMGPYPLFTINPYFTELVDKIPQCPQTPEDVKNVEMLNTVWGQVFPTTIFTGGRFDCISSINDSLLQKYDSSWVMSQLSLKFTYEGFDLYAGGFSNRSEIQISKIFEEASSTNLFFVGGDPAFQSNGTEKEWFESVPQWPGLVSASFLPLTTLFNDPVKGANVNYMLSNYINTGKFEIPPCAKESKPKPSSSSSSSVGDLSPIPGTISIGAGYDTLTMTVKTPIIQSSYKLGNTWSNPFYPQYSYSVSDTLFVSDQTNNFEANFTSIAMSDSQFEMQLQSQVSGSSGFLNFGHESSSMSVYQYYHELHQYDQSRNTRSLTWYNLELSPLVEAFPLNYLTPWAEKVFLNLGKNISDPAVYQQYWEAIEFFGNALVRQASVGGSFDFQAYLQDNLVKAITTEKFQEESSWSFLGIFGSQSSYNFFQNSTSDVVKENTVCEITVNGGVWDASAHPFLHNTTSGGYSFALKDATGPVLSWQTFVDSIKDNMVPTRYEIVPMHTIFSDPVIAANYKLVAEAYVQTTK